MRWRSAARAQLRNGRAFRHYRCPCPAARRYDNQYVLPKINLAGTVDPRANLVPRFGILGLTLDLRIASMLPPQRLGGGVIVVSTVAGAIDSREGGLPPGDVI